MRFLTAVVAALWMASLAPTAAHASPSHDLLVRLAERHQHSWAHDRLSFAELARVYARGGRLRLSCGNIASVARRLLRHHGFAARRVAVVTRGRMNGYNDGHTMLEVRQDGRWVLYDLTGNRMAVDSDGRRIGVVEQVARVHAGVPRWQRIASDRLYDLGGLRAAIRETRAPYRRVARDMRRIFRDADWFDRRVFGTALLPTDRAGRGRSWAFGDDTDRQRLESASDLWRWADPALWARLRVSGL